MSRTTKYPKLSDQIWLSEQLKTKTLVQIAKELGTSVGNVGDRVRRYKLQFASSKSEAVKAALKKRFPNGRFGKNASNWKGGKHIYNGYYVIHIINHPRGGKDRRVFEHILVAEKTLGRYLTTNEIVHHINGNKLDNRPENLKVMKRSEHVGYHFSSGNNIQDLVKRIEYLESLLKQNSIPY